LILFYYTGENQDWHALQQCDTQKVIVITAASLVQHVQHIQAKKVITIQDEYISCLFPATILSIKGTSLRPFLDKNCKTVISATQIASALYNSILSQNDIHSLLLQLDVTSHGTISKQVFPKDVCFSTYFTLRGDPWQNSEVYKDEFFMVRNWYNSLVQLDLNGVLFYDDLNPSFVSRFATDQIHFLPTHATRQSNRSNNDLRFYVYKQFLEQQQQQQQNQQDLVVPVFEYVLFTDSFDVNIHKNPFEFMRSVTSEHVSQGKQAPLFVGSEQYIEISSAFEEWLRLRNYFCKLPIEEYFNKNKFLWNPGIIGGRLDVVIEFLQHMLQILDSTPPSENCNMPAFNYVMENHFVNRAVYGEPWHSPYKLYNTSTYFYIKHK
jgi:hypothetical protein